MRLQMGSEFFQQCTCHSNFFQPEYFPAVIFRARVSLGFLLLEAWLLAPLPTLPT